MIIQEKATEEQLKTKKAKLSFLATKHTRHIFEYITILDT